MENSQEKMKTIDTFIRNKMKNSTDNFTLFEPTPENYTAIYARISGQNDSFSIPSQIEACKKYAEANNLFVYDIYEDKKSARKIHFYERPDFKRLLNDMESGMFKNIILIRRDRLSRRIDDFMQLRRIFERLNVNVFYIKEGNLNFDSSSYITNFIENILMSISTLEPEYIYQRTKGGRQNLRNVGMFLSSIPPIGYYRVQREKHVFKIHKDEAKIVRAIFDNYEELIIKSNKTISDLTAYIQSTGLEKVSERPSRIDNSLVKKLIQRPLYGGKMIEEEGFDIEDCIIWDKDNGVYLLDESKFIDCENFKSFVSWNKWKEIFLHYYLEEHGPLEMNYLFKDLLYCKDCEAPLILEENYYKCPNKCFEVHIDTVISIVSKEIIHKINSLYLKKIFQNKIIKTNQMMSNQNKLLTSKQKTLRNKVSKFIDSNDETKAKEIEFFQKEIDSIKDVISKLGGNKIKFANILNNIELFKQYLIDFKEKDILFIKENWEVYNNMISKFIAKVVCKSKNGKLSIRVTYKK